MTESHVQIVTKNSTFVVNKKKLVDLSVRLHFNVDEVVVDLVKFVHSETGAIVSIDGEERHRLRKQLSAIKVRYQAAAKKGGRQRDSFPAESNKCQVVIRVSDINSVTKLIEENKKLTSEREDVRTECAELRAANALIRQELYNVEQKAIRQNRKVTPKENYSERHKRRVRKTLAETAKTYKLDTDDTPQAKPVDAGAVASVLDKENISLRKYHQLAQLTPNLPRKHQVQTERKRLEKCVLHTCV